MLDYEVKAVGGKSIEAFFPLPKVAAMLGVARRTVERLIASGDLRRCKVRGRSVVPASSYAAYVDRVTQGGPR